MKRVIVDSSSAILLYKTDLFRNLTDAYNVILPESVYHEISIDGYKGSKYFKSYYKDSKLTLATPESDENYNIKLGKGERDSILLFYQDYGDFVILDDAKGAKFCRNNLLQS